MICDIIVFGTPYGLVVAFQKTYFERDTTILHIV